MPSLYYHQTSTTLVQLYVSTALRPVYVQSLLPLDQYCSSPTVCLPHLHQFMPSLYYCWTSTILVQLYVSTTLTPVYAQCLLLLDQYFYSPTVHLYRTYTSLCPVSTTSTAIAQLYVYHITSATDFVLMSNTVPFSKDNRKTLDLLVAPQRHLFYETCTAFRSQGGSPRLCDSLRSNTPPTPTRLSLQSALLFCNVDYIFSFNCCTCFRWLAESHPSGCFYLFAPKFWDGGEDL